jgi:hypothetical protein
VPPCEGPSPTAFTFLGPNPVTVPAQSCVVVPVRITRPAGLLAGQHSCYMMQATNLATNQGPICSGSLLAINALCLQLTHGLEAMAGVPIGRASTIEFTLTNPNSDPVPFPYEFAAMPANMEPGSAPISLNGLPPGEPVSGMVVVNPGQSVPVSVSVSFVEHDPFRFYDIVLLTDLDGDGVIAPNEVIAATGARSLPASACPADFNNDGAVNSQDFFDFLNAFFAFAGIADFNHDGVINSQDFFDFVTAFFAGC